MSSVTIWILIGIAALIIDLITSSFLFIWFTAGALAAVIASMLNLSLTVQIIVFLLVSIVLIYTGYPLVKKTIKGTIAKTPTLEQSYIGRELILEEDIIDKATIKIGGIYWTVINEGEPAKRGDTVKIIGVEGNKIQIQKL